MYQFTPNQKFEKFSEEFLIGNFVKDFIKINNLRKFRKKFSVFDF